MIAVPTFNMQDPTNPNSYVEKAEIPGFPLYWRDETTGKMGDAVLAYLEQKCGSEQLRVVIAYLQHHIHAPIWLEYSPPTEMVKAIEESRAESLTLETVEEVNNYLTKLQEIGLDPL